MANVELLETLFQDFVMQLLTNEEACQEAVTKYHINPADIQDYMVVQDA